MRPIWDPTTWFKSKLHYNNDNDDDDDDDDNNNNIIIIIISSSSWIIILIIIIMKMMMMVMIMMMMMMMMMITLNMTIYLCNEHITIIASRRFTTKSHRWLQIKRKLDFKHTYSEQSCECKDYIENVSIYKKK